MVDTPEVDLQYVNHRWVLCPGSVAQAKTQLSRVLAGWRATLFDGVRSLSFSPALLRAHAPLLSHASADAAAGMVGLVQLRLDQSGSRL